MEADTLLVVDSGEFPQVISDKEQTGDSLKRQWHQSSALFREKQNFYLKDVNEPNKSRKLSSRFNFLVITVNWNEFWLFAIAVCSEVVLTSFPVSNNSGCTGGYISGKDVYGHWLSSGGNRIVAMNPWGWTEYLRGQRMGQGQQGGGNLPVATNVHRPLA